MVSLRLATRVVLGLRRRLEPTGQLYLFTSPQLGRSLDLGAFLQPGTSCIFSQVQ
jgi:hypothetical protein